MGKLFFRPAASVSETSLTFFSLQVLALSLLHYSVTYASSVALIWSGAVENKPFSHFREFLPVCVLNTGSVCLLNLSLATNSIGVYQLSKMMTVPGTVLVSFLMYGRTYSMEVLGSLATMTAGIVLSIGGRVSIDMMGAVFAIVAVALVCLSSVQSGELQKKYKLDPTVLMYNIMPPQMAMLALVTMLFEPVFPGQPGSIFEYAWTLQSALCVIATAIFALLLNLSGLWVLGVFSPVTYSVVGYGKTASVLATGILVFGDEFTLPIFFGICLVFGGAIWYNKAT